MKSIITALLLLVSVAAVTGCTMLKPLFSPEPNWKPVTEEPVPVPQENPDALAYFSYLQELTDVELGSEYRAVKQRYASSPNEEDRWRLIFLSILPGQPFSDREYTLELLRESRKQASAENEQRAGLGKLLRLLLADQRELNRKLVEEKQRAEKLAQQLQELKDIEKILSEREKKRPAGN